MHLEFGFICYVRFLDILWLIYFWAVMDNLGVLESDEVNSFHSQEISAWRSATVLAPIRSFVE
jgi:hypothetical protein